MMLRSSIWEEVKTIEDRISMYIVQREIEKIIFHLSYTEYSDENLKRLQEIRRDFRNDIRGKLE